MAACAGICTAGRCKTTAIALAYSPLSDPEVMNAVEQVTAFLGLLKDRELDLEQLKAAWPRDERHSVCEPTVCTVRLVVCADLVAVSGPP